MKNVKHVLCLLLAAFLVAAPAAGRHHDFRGHVNLRQHRDFLKRSWISSLESALCIPAASSLIEKNEGRHECAYDHSGGFRAVGVGYNLDNDVDARKAELLRLFADYDKVYKGESCLNRLQISALLALDAKRALDKASSAIASFDDLCCEVEAVFADVAHSVASRPFPDDDLENFVAKVVLQKWGSAAEELKETNWCDDHRKRCEDDIDAVKRGCDDSVEYHMEDED